MKKSLLFVSLVLSVAVVAGALALAAVSSADETTITGAGSSWVYPLVAKWSAEYTNQDRH